MQLLTKNPTDPLHNGDVHDFREAVTLHIAGCRVESGIGDDGYWREQATRAESALRIYEDLIDRSTEQVVTALRVAGLNDFADCLEIRRYEALAI